MPMTVSLLLLQMRREERKNADLVSERHHSLIGTFFFLSSLVLDHRPAPPGVELTINRDDPTEVIVNVLLPGFTLDNITVAMRRGHKVHVVADSYGPNGGASPYPPHLPSPFRNQA